MKERKKEKKDGSKEEQKNNKQKKRERKKEKDGRRKEGKNKDCYNYLLWLFTHRTMTKMMLPCNSQILKYHPSQILNYNVTQ